MEKNVIELMKLGEESFNKNVHEELRKNLTPNEKQMWINGYLAHLINSSKEVTNEEIDKAVVEHFPSDLEGIFSERLAFRVGAKWYREQLKSRQ